MNSNKIKIASNVKIKTFVEETVLKSLRKIFT
jgi:hypothetical protein